MIPVICDVWIMESLQLRYIIRYLNIDPIPHRVAFRTGCKFLVFYSQITILHSNKQCVMQFLL